MPRKASPQTILLNLNIHIQLASIDGRLSPGSASDRYHSIAQMSDVFVYNTLDSLGVELSPTIGEGEV